MPKKKPTSFVTKLQWITIFIAIFSLIVTFTEISFQGISSSISSYFFPKTDYTVESLDIPTILPTDFRQSLLVSPEYFVVTSVSLKSDRPYQGEPMRFSLSFNNNGKKSVKQPRLMVYFVDFMYRSWNVWNESITNDFFIRGCSFEYHFPPIDQKTIGAWVVFVLLYDDAEGALVSYVAREFTVTDVAPTLFWQSIAFLMILIYILAMLVLSIRLWRKGRFPKIFGIFFGKPKDNESENKDNES